MISNCAAASLAIASVPDPTAPPVPASETWYVAARSGTVAMTLDELDEALGRGEVDSSTLMWIPGMSEWEALGCVANLEDGPPLECMPGQMLEYGLDAERALQNEDGSLRPSVGDVRDYDPFSFPPPADNIPDPNRALWASILPPAPDAPPASAALPIEPWWRPEGRAPWVGVLVTGTLVLCLSLLGVAERLFHPSSKADVRAATLALQMAPAPFAAVPAPESSVEEASTAASPVRPFGAELRGADSRSEVGAAIDSASVESAGAERVAAVSAAPELVRYEEPANPREVAAEKRTARSERGKAGSKTTARAKATRSSRGGVRRR